MEAAKSESKKLKRDIQKLTDQLQHSTERADENSKALKRAEEQFESRKKTIEREIEEDRKSLHTTLMKAIEDVRKYKAQMVVANQRREKQSQTQSI